MKPATPINVSFVTASAGTLPRCVQRLLQMAETSDPRYETFIRGIAALQMLVLGAIFCLALLVISNPAWLWGAHQLIEAFVRGLQ